MAHTLKGDRPAVAAVILGGIRRQAIEKAASEGADLLETRIDCFRGPEPGKIAASFEKLREFSALPVILTIRSRAEGGRAEFTDQERLELFSALIPFADYVDIERSSGRILKNVVKSAKAKRKKVIISYHNFNSTPGDKKLKGIVESGRASGADIVKVATQVGSPADLRRLARLLSAFDNLIVIGMGEQGAASRVFFPMIGSLVSYGFISGKTAPGQMSLRDLKREFRRYGF